jgi:hypothetical protein
MTKSTPTYHVFHNAQARLMHVKRIHRRYSRIADSVAALCWSPSLDAYKDKLMSPRARHVTVVFSAYKPKTIRLTLNPSRFKCNCVYVCRCVSECVCVCLFLSCGLESRSDSLCFCFGFARNIPWSNDCPCTLSQSHHDRTGYPVNITGYASSQNTDFP